MKHAVWNTFGDVTNSNYTTMLECYTTHTR